MEQKHDRQLAVNVLCPRCPAATAPTGDALRTRTTRVHGVVTERDVAAAAPPSTYPDALADGVARAHAHAGAGPCGRAAAAYREAETAGVAAAAAAVLALRLAGQDADVRCCVGAGP